MPSLQMIDYITCLGINKTLPGPKPYSVHVYPDRGLCGTKAPPRGGAANRSHPSSNTQPSTPITPHKGPQLPIILHPSSIFLGRVQVIQAIWPRTCRKPAYAHFFMQFPEQGIHTEHICNTQSARASFGTAVVIGQVFCLLGNSFALVFDDFGRT